MLTDRKTAVLVSSEGQHFRVPYKCLGLSRVLAYMLAVLGDRKEAIPLPNVDTETLRDVVAWMNLHEHDDLSEAAFKQCAVAHPSDRELFGSGCSDAVRHKLLRASDYLDAPFLRDSVLHGKYPCIVLAANDGSQFLVPHQALGHIHRLKDQALADKPIRLYFTARVVAIISAWLWEHAEDEHKVVPFRLLGTELRHPADTVLLGPSCLPELRSLLLRAARLMDVPRLYDAAMREQYDMVVLISSDKVPFVVPRKALGHCFRLKNFADSDMPVPVPNVKAKTLKLIVAWLWLHVEDKHEYPRFQRYNVLLPRHPADSALFGESAISDRQRARLMKAADALDAPRLTDSILAEAVVILRGYYVDQVFRFSNTVQQYLTKSQPFWKLGGI